MKLDKDFHLASDHYHRRQIHKKGYGDEWAIVLLFILAIVIPIAIALGWIR